MHFDAIVHAPTLRVGARINIAAADQSADGPAPFYLGPGADVRLRLGVCCPDLARGTITGASAAEPKTLVLTVGGSAWTLVRSVGGITDPGLFSETWFVAASETMR